MRIAHPPWRWPLFLGWFVTSGIFAGLLCLLPLTNTVGYEFALLLSLIVSLGSGHLAAAYPGRIRDQNAAFPGARFPVIAVYMKALAHGLALLLLPVTISLLNGLRVPPCNLSDGASFFALIPVPAVFLAAAFGTLCGLAAPGPRTASVLWFLLFVGSLILAVSRFHSTPAVFLFGPFFGYFPGVLYDTLISIDHRLITYRLAGSIHCALVLSICVAMMDTATLRLDPRRLKGRSKATFAVAILVAANLALFGAAPSMGHRTERSNLIEELSVHRKVSDRLHLHFSPRTATETVETLADDAAFSLSRVDAFLKPAHKQRIDVFFFDNAPHKGSLMGASGTNVAKPWRSEVYVIVDAVPHPVLRHELAHAVSAEFARGPFKVAGSLGGLWPNPGLIEGLAVAAQGPRTDLTVHQWSAAMKRLDILPDLGSIFGLGFLDMAASTAYTAAGSFCLWIAENEGAETLTRVYGGASWREATGKDLSSLERGWHEFLDGVHLEQADVAAARLRFDRPSVIGSVCVHEVARLEQEAFASAGNGRHQRAIDLLREAHRVSGQATKTRHDLYDGLITAGMVDGSRSMSREMEDDASTGLAQKARVQETMADLDASEGRLATAREVFRILAADASSEGDRRRLQMKHHLAGLPEQFSGPILLALARRPGPDAPSTPLLMLYIAEAAAAFSDDPWLAYLLARQHANLGDHDGALELMDRADELGVESTTPSIALSARQIRGIALLEAGEYVDARRVFEAIAADPGVREGARAQAADWSSRCSFQAAIKR